ASSGKPDGAGNPWKLQPAVFFELSASTSGRKLPCARSSRRESSRAPRRLGGQSALAAISCRGGVSNRSRGLGHELPAGHQLEHSFYAQGPAPTIVADSLCHGCDCWEHAFPGI